MKTIAIAIGVMLSTLAYSQEEQPEKRVQWGFNVGGNYSLVQSSSTEVGVKNDLGLRLGILADIKINDRLSLMPRAELSWNNGYATVDYVDSFYYYSIYVNSLDFAVHAKYNLTEKEHTPFISVGPSIKIPTWGPEISSNRPFKSDYSLGVDIGLGFQQNLRYFNLQPELRYTYGLTKFYDMNKTNHVMFHNIALILNFVG